MNEILVILQEECAEVIQSVSKIHRFGLTDEKKDHLQHELGDLQCMIDLCVENDIVELDKIVSYKKDKREKLKLWSNINLI